MCEGVGEGAIREGDKYARQMGDLDSACHPLEGLGGDHMTSFLLSLNFKIRFQI